MPETFQLDARLQADTYFVANTPLCQLQLMNDCRWPWLILVPKRPDISELTELATDDLWQLTSDIVAVSRLMKALYEPDKINVGSLGNIVRQLHVHVIARNEADPGWPGPVWGFEKARPYNPQNAEEICAHIARESKEFSQHG